MGGLMKKCLFVLLICSCTAVYLFAQDNSYSNNTEEIVESEKQYPETENSNEKIIGLIISGSGFNSFRLGGGIFFASFTKDKYHIYGWDTGLLHEYNVNNRINYDRLYFHITGGVALALLGGSMVLAYDKDDISIGFAPEVGIGISSVFGFFFRYNFYLNNKFNSYEIVFQVNLCKISLSEKTFKYIF